MSSNFVANMIVEASRMTERKSTEDWISSQLERQKDLRLSVANFEASFVEKAKTPGQSIDTLNASLAMMNKALKELRAAGFSIEVYGGHGEVSYFMSGGPV